MLTIDDLHEKGLLLFDAISGSRAYGLETEASDTDKKGVFFLPRDYFFGTKYIAQVASDRNDLVYYEVGRFVELLGKSNPAALELLGTPERAVLYRHPLMGLLLPEMALSKHARNTFSGHALSQVKRAGRRHRDAGNPGGPPPGKGYDAKNMMHAIRLLEVARELFETGRMNIVSHNRAELLAIKRGEWTFENLLARAEQLMRETDAAAGRSTLPGEPDRQRLEEVLVSIRTALYHRP